MTIQQLSVFVENKSGRLNELFDIIGRSNIRILAATLADTSEFGILRLITNDNERAFELLKANHVSVNRSEVLVLASTGHAECFARQFSLFAAAGVSVEYMYCFSHSNCAYMVVRLNNLALAQQVIHDNELQIISEEELKGA